MAKHGVLFETDNFIKNCINRGAVATFDIDGGAPVVVGGVNATDKELYNLTKYDDEAQVAIAYNPSVKYDVIGGNLFPAKSLDDRNYYNPANKVVDIFIPEKNIEFGVTMANIDGTTAPTVGQFLEPKADSTVFEIKSSQTTGVPSFEVIEIKEVKYPTFDFTEDVEKIYVVKTRFNG
ncbi:MAG: hypothetical protein KBT03_13485 [Bacteroidales bacterium]|nr:hypothetical protein [Candidatus Scybalousia scybalohippi]